MRGDVRIGDMWFTLAQGAYSDTGIRPLRRAWRSLFAERDNVSGGPGIQNVRTDDLRWLLDDFSGGEGRRVQKPNDDRPMFERSVGIDLANPGELRLARSMQQVGLTGAGATTVQASTWSDDVGTSTVVNTDDRRLNAVGDRIKKNVTLGSGGFYQFGFFGYEADADEILGNTLNKVQGQTHLDNPNTAIVLETEGTIVQTGPQTPAVGQVVVSCEVKFSSGSPFANGKVELIVYNADSDKNVVQDDMTISLSGGSTSKTDTIKVSFTAKASTTYRYRLKAISFSYATGHTNVAVNSFTVDERDDRKMKWQIKDGSTVLASGTETLNGTTHSTKVASPSLLLAAGTYTLTAERTSGTSRRQFLDKATYENSGLRQAYVAELGLNGDIWIVDYTSSAPPQLFYWDPQHEKWVSIGNAGPNGGKAVALAHSDNYEFVALDNDIVYRGKKPATFERYSATLADKVAGIAVGAGRVYALTESVAAGTALYEAPLEGTPNVAWTARSVEGLGLGVNLDQTISQRIAGLANGCVFFVNQGADCTVYVWDAGASTGEPFAPLPRGFNARAIVHGLGLTWVAGGFPAIDENAAERVRPAIFAIDSSGGVQELDVRLWRDDDPGTQIRSAELYGENLYVVAEVKTDPAKMRLWRIDLAGTPAAFLEQEITTDESQANGTARSVALNWRDKVMLWSKGFPYHEQDDRYRTAQDAVLRSSRYNYGLTEEKLFLTARCVGTFPNGTSMDVRYAVDDGSMVPVGTFTHSGRLVISGPDQPVSFTFVQVEVELHTDDPDVTPVVYSVEFKAWLQKLDKGWELLIDTIDEKATFHIAGQQLKGAQAISYLFDLAADSGGLVEFEDAFTDPESPSIYDVLVEQPEVSMLQPGGGLFRVTLTERNL